MFLKKKKILIWALAFICAMLVVAIGALLFASEMTAQAYDSTNMPTGEKLIGNIYDSSTGSFSKDNLDELAQSIKNSDGGIKYLNINSLIEYAESGGVATASDFGDIAVYFGKANNGTGEELAWIPAYVSKDINGNAILTLWLATTESSNDPGKLQEQEVSKFSDGTSSEQKTSPWPSSNNYSTSYIRAMINNGGSYYGDWDGTYDPTKKSLAAANSNKFAMYATGALSNYITVPADMSWQKDAGYLIGDPKYINDNYVTIFDGYDAWSSADWLNDKLWLPSVYELYKKEIPTTDINNGIFYNPRGGDGGLWEMTADERMSSNKETWLRTGFLEQNTDNVTHNSVFILAMNGTIAKGDVKSVFPYSVRPALHLNLSAVLDTLTPKVEVSIGGGSDPNPIKKEFPNIAAAWSYATTESFGPATVKLLADVTASQTLNVGSGENVTLNLNGYALTGRVDGSLINVEGTFTLTDSNMMSVHKYNIDDTTGKWIFGEDGIYTLEGGYITNSGTANTGGGVNVAGGTFTMKSGTIAGCEANQGGGVSCGADGKFILDDVGMIAGNIALNGGGLYVISSESNTDVSFEMKGGMINKNVAYSTTTINGCGGGIYIANGKMTMSDGMISANAAKSGGRALGGGVCMDNATFTMTGGDIINNRVNGPNGSYGGGVYVIGTFTMESGSISNNRITEVIKCYGGGVYVAEDSTFTMRNGTISKNTLNADSNSNGHGGGVYNEGTFTMWDGTISGNTSRLGGGVSDMKGTFTMEGGTIGGSSENANVATYYGGGVYLRNVASTSYPVFNLKNGKITHNHAVDSGGVYVNVGTFNMTGGTITQNVGTNVSGSGVYVSTSASAIMSVSGAVNITGNGNGTTENNVYLPSGKKITVTGALSEKTKIGVTLADGYTDAFTSGYYNNNKYGESPLTPMYFVSDNKALPCVYLDGSNEVCIGTHQCGISGVCMNCKKQMAAKVVIGGAITAYDTLEEAWAVANGDGVTQSNPATVTMFTDATIQETLVVKSGKQITLVLNGHKLEFAGASGSVIRVEGTFKAQHSPDGSYVTATQNTVKNPNDNYKEVAISGSVITGGKGTEQQSDGKTVTLGGGVFVAENGSFTFGNNVAVAGNTADFGGGVRVDKNATFTMQDSAEISYNRANIDGGGLCVCNAHSISLAGIIHSNAAAAGGGIYFEGSNSQGIASDYKTQGLLFVTDNKVTVKDKVDYSGRGGGIYIDNCTVEIGGTGATNIDYNTSTKEGGGVYVKSNGTLKAYGRVNIANNTKDGKNNNVFLEGTANKIIVSDVVDSNYGNFCIYVNNTGAVITGLTSTNNAQGTKPSNFFHADDEANDCVWISNADSGEVTIGHAGGTATCQQLATCEHCNNEYGNYGEHTFEQYDNDVHCSDCGVKAVAATIYANGDDCVYYTTFDAAWEAAVSGDTKYLVLLSNADIENTLMLTSGQTLYLCLNGYKLELTGDSGSVIESHGNLSVYGTYAFNGPTEMQNLASKYKNTDFSDHTVSDPTSSTGATSVTIRSGLITGGKGMSELGITRGGGIFQSGGSLNIYGGYIAGNEAYLGGGVYINNSSLYICNNFSENGGYIAFNKATDGGGVYAYNLSSFDLQSGGFISSNLATRGGGIFFDNSALPMSPYYIYGTIQGNSATVAKTGVVNAGGGIYVKTSRVRIDGSEAYIQNNNASNGGGVYLQSGGLTMTDGGINNNKAENGGGVYVELGEFTMTGGSMFNNNATAGGGGVYIKNGAFEMSDGELYRNQAANGGGIYSFEARNFTISGTAKIGKPYIQKSSSSNKWGNTAEYGGGVFLRGGTLTMSGGKIQYNCATKDGGGLYVDNGNGSTFDMSGGEISGNDAARNGGGVLYYGTRFNVSGDAVIAENTKSSAGNNVFLGGENSKITVAGAINALLIYVHNTGAVITGLTSEKYSNAHVPSDFFHADSMADNCVWISNGLIGEVTIGHNYNTDGVCTECGSTKQIYWGISEDGTLILSGSVSDITSDEVNSFDFNASFASSSAPWFSQAASIKRIVIKDGVAPTKMTFWFRYLSNVERIDMSGLDASNVTDMASLFNGCSKLTEIIFPEVFDTPKLTDMNAMFYDFTSLTYVDVTQFDTSHVYNMYGLFGNCSSLTSIDLSSFDISRCTDLNDMFKGCTALVTIKAPSTVGTKEAPLSAAFADSEGNAFTSLTSAAEGKTLTKVTKLYWGVFNDGKTLIISGLERYVAGAQSKGSFDIDAQFSLSDSAPWNDFKNSIREVTITKGVAPKSTAYWFYGFDKLADIDMSGLHMTNDTHTNAMLDGCTALMTVKVPATVGTKEIVLPAAFLDADRNEFTSITSEVQGEILTKAIKIYWGVFDEGKTLIISGLESDVQNATAKGNFYFDFEFDPSQYGHKVPWAYYAMDIEQVRIINGVAPKYMARWFMDFNKLVDIDFSGLDTSNVVSMESMFYNCTSLTSLDLSNFNTEKVTDMRDMFCGCAKLTSLDISSFDTSNLTAASIEGEGGNPNMVLMFEHCDKLNTIKAPKKMNDMFALMPAKHVDEFTLVSVKFWNGTKDVSVLSKASVGKTLTRHDGHSYSWVTVSEATCTQAGSKKQVCSICGADGDTQTVAALGHSWGEPVWTWSADGKTASAKFTCSHDGTHVNTLSATITSAVKTAATCSAKGTTTYTARVTSGGREYSSTKDIADIAMLAHSFDEWQEMIAPTCSATGTKGHKDCLICHKHFDDSGVEIADLTIAIDGNAHSFSEWQAIIVPTCSATGTKGHKDCLICHKHFDDSDAEIADLTIAIDGNAHSWGEWTVTKQPTLEEFGEKKRICAHDSTHVETVQMPKRVSQLVKPDGNGGDNKVVITTPDGFAPDTELIVTEIARENYGAYETIAQTVDGVISFVYDVALKSDGVTVQPDGMLTVRLRIPENLQGKPFKLFSNLNEGTATDTEYTVDGAYAVVTTDKLSEFIFVGEKEIHSSSNTVWIVLIAILAVVVALEVGYIVYGEIRKKKMTEGRK